MSRLLDALDRSQEEASLGKPTPLADLFDHPGSPPPAELSSVPSVQPSLAPESRLEVLTNPYDFGAEQFRVLGARLQHLAETRSLKTLLVTSASFQEGKSLVCLNLAITLAKRAGKKVLLVEGDLRKPALCQMLGLPRLRGVSDWVQSNEPLTNFLYRLAGLDLWLLPAGESCAQPLEAIQLLRQRDLPAQASRYFDWIVIDSAPLLVADSSILSRMADGTLVVVRQESTQKKRLQKSLASVEKVLGFVLNNATSIDPHDYDHYHTLAKSNGNGNHAGRKTPSETPSTSTDSNGVNAIAS
ncbi:MAG: CpsD/CapB family tyrosine-protein kinase [Terriglobales bacterium]